MQNMTYHIVTFGCQMNEHESEKLAGLLEKLGYTFSQTRDDADVIIFNTCAIREGAVDRAFGNVGALKSLKQNHREKIIAVCGCMTQQKENAEKLYKMFPFIDIIIGTFNMHEFELYLQKFINERKRFVKIEDDEKEIEHFCKAVRTSGDNAWVNIVYGCNNFCSYCVVPYVRGRERSRKKEDILNEIKNLIAEKKYKTITLLGQNVNSYGNDKEGNGNFSNLLKEICKLDGDFKITFISSHPKDFSDELIETISNEEKILKEIHLPAQSGSNRILKLMNRKYTREEYLNLIKKIKEKIPNAQISSDFIVGFPSETDEDFLETLELVKTVNYERIFAFMYSKRLNTPASLMEEQVDEQVKNLRVNLMLKTEKAIQHIRNCEKSSTNFKKLWSRPINKKVNVM